MTTSMKFLQTTETKIETPTLIVKAEPTLWARVTGPVSYDTLCNTREDYLKYNEEQRQAQRGIQDDSMFNTAVVKHYWTGNCSEYVAKHGRSYSQKKKNGGRMWTPQHRWPRSVVMHLLYMNTPPSLKEYIDICENKYLLHDLTTSRENKVLCPLQKIKVFVSPEIVDKKSGIIIVKAPFS